jgi:hypothetical protein
MYGARAMGARARATSGALQRLRCGGTFGASAAGAADADAGKAAASVPADGTATVNCEPFTEDTEVKKRTQRNSSRKEKARGDESRAFCFLLKFRTAVSSRTG